MNPWGTSSVPARLTLTERLAAVEAQKDLAFATEMPG
jgi:hypothetical protein